MLSTPFVDNDNYYARHAGNIEQTYHTNLYTSKTDKLLTFNYA